MTAVAIFAVCCSWVQAPRCRLLLTEGAKRLGLHRLNSAKGEHEWLLEENLINKALFERYNTNGGQVYKLR